MSMFRRPKKSIRPRVVTMGEDEEEDNGMEVDSPGPSEEKETKSKSRPKNDRDNDSKSAAPKALLSFHHEEENEEAEVFKVKKSSVSRKLIKQREKEKSGSQDFKSSKSAARPHKTDYEPERISAPNKTNDQKGLGRILTGREAEAVEMESEDEEDNNMHFRRPARSNVTEAVRLTLERDQIPDANLIHEARKRRQLARETGGSGPMPSTIALESRRSDSSRFIREDDENDKSDEDDDRLDFSTATNADKIAREKRVEVFNAAEDENRDRQSEESDIEIDEWEKQQISKAIRKDQLQQVTADTQNFFANSPQNDYQSSKNEQFVAAASFNDAPKEKIKLVSSNINTVSPTVTIDDIISGKNRVTSESIFKRLAERLEILKISRDRNAGELSRITNELEVIDNDKDDVSLSKPKLSSRYVLYQKLQGYFADLIDCMRYKIPVIESIEKRVLDLMKTKSNRLIERRRKDTAEQLEEINTSIKIMSGNIMQLPSTDEMRMKRAAEREGRRTRRRRNREIKSVENHKDGLSSDDEETEFEINSYKIQMENLLLEAATVFEDVSEDFSTIQGILAMFMEWRVCDFDSYKESYAYMIISKCLAPLIRLEIIRWDPLVNELDFSQFSWVKSLLKYNFRKDESLQDISTDVDSKLIPSVAEKVLVPWVDVVVKAKWDPSSTSQTRKLVNVVKKLIMDWFVAPNSKSIRSLLASIISKFKTALENDVYIPIFPKHATATRNAPAAVFASRQFWSGVKLLDNMAVWAGILSDDILQILALDALLTRYLLLGVRTAPELGESAEKAAGVVAVIPTVWISKDPEAEPPNGIHQFSHCLLSMVQGTDFMVATNKIALQDIAKVLRNIGCSLEAEMILKKYS